jgi:hypothetical protein
MPLDSSRIKHSGRRCVHRLAYRVQVESGVDGCRLLTLVIQALADDRHGSAGLGLPASEGAAQVVNAQVLDAHIINIDASLLCHHPCPCQLRFDGLGYWVTCHRVGGFSKVTSFRFNPFDQLGEFVPIEYSQSALMGFHEMPGLAMTWENVGRVFLGAIPTATQYGERFR